MSDGLLALLPPLVGWLIGRGDIGRGDIGHGDIGRGEVLRETVPGHDPLAPPPKLAQLDELVAAAPPGGPRVLLEREGDVRQVDASIELAAYRVVQEALTNAARHAGRVDVRVLLAYEPARLTVRVTNPVPGRTGTIGDGAGVGLIGMRERVELLGGSVRVSDHAGTFEVCATLPLRSTS
ncbi:hypothetical protein Misp01_45080 [Microtetraspora sp. NBRC 13810]|uniref:sensor histidine kinase n=1 Tax=Microtetraspora sp. NBRC 13810 TaxID=3030990 RepID=UPI00249F9D5B|nr:ATP-binding protein [Microtetraspora sp. NBRC 13810]GLW09379.1 hypothetical protein Misp01_45080 [Microtetraspora sp. NBRC 13810]